MTKKYATGLLEETIKHLYPNIYEKMNPVFFIAKQDILYFLDIAYCQGYNDAIEKKEENKLYIKERFEDFL